MKKSLALFLVFVMLFATCGTAFAATGDFVGTDVYEESMDAAREIAREGYVLLENNNDSLPIESGVKVNVFGTSSVDPLYGGGGSGSITVQPGYDFYTALSNAGIKYNTELYEAYSNWYDAYGDDNTYVGPSGSGADGHVLSSAMNAEWDIINDKLDVDGNVRRAKMDPQILANAEEYSDTAIIYIARAGSEFTDMAFEALYLREEEVSMIDYVTATYDNVIVILNTMNTIELGWLEGDAEYTFSGYKYGEGSSGCWGGGGTSYTVEYDEPHTYTLDAVDSALLIYGPGENGSAAVMDVLTGAVNPSGRTVDTFAYDVDTNPTTYNVGSWDFTGTSTPFNVYEESIYVGYLYYETFAPDEVQYPFGYGLSYTTFEWSDFETTLGVNEYGEETINVNVTVTNTGDIAGKDVVELYYSQPYYNNSAYCVEKALVNLGAFAKTSVLEPGASETVTLVCNVRDMASWSSHVAAYVLELGNYAITVATNANTAHTAPAYTYNYNVEETVLYTSDEVTGTEYKVLFDDAEGIGEVTEGYMHRVDVAGVPTVQNGTFPESPDGTEYIDFAGRIEKYGTHYYKDYADLVSPDMSDFEASDIADAEEQNVVYYDENGDIDIYKLQEVYYDLQAEDADEDAIWDKFLDQLNVYDMIYLTHSCGFKSADLEQYGIVLTACQDGPAALKYSGYAPRHYEGTVQGDGVGFPMYVCVASTWNVDMSRLYGEMIGKTGRMNDSSGWYAPAVNIHRNAICGRNFEYFSEDSYLTGMMCAPAIQGAYEYGVVAYLKHFALNDQETDRQGICTFANEQAIREVYLEAFEITVKNSDCVAIMSSFNRIGITWAGANNDLLNGVLRGEWGFRGEVLTDWYGGGYNRETYMDCVLMVLNGGDTLLQPGGVVSRNADTQGFSVLARRALNYYELDPVGMLDALRTAVKNSMYRRFETFAFERSLSDDYQWADYVSGNEWYTELVIGSTEIGLTTEKQEDMIEIPVSFNYNEGISAAKITFSGIDFTGAEVEVNHGDVEYNNRGEDLILEWWEMTGEMYDGLLFTIKLPYTMNNLLANGTYTITAIDEDVVDNIILPDELKIVNGTLTVANVYPAGDVTGDFVVSNADVITVARYLVGLYEEGSAEAIAVETYGDLDDNGVITNIDLIRLARMIVE